MKVLKIYFYISFVALKINACKHSNDFEFFNKQCIFSIKVLSFYLCIFLWEKAIGFFYQRYGFLNKN